MKSLMIMSYDVKELMSILFTSIIMTYGIVCFFTGNTLMPLELLWEFLLLAIILGALQIIFYSEKIFPKVHISIKVISHYILTTIIIAIFILWFNWILLWGISLYAFFIIYTGYFLIAAISFYVYTKVTGEKFNEKLLKYKNNLRENSEG